MQADRESREDLEFFSTVPKEIGYPNCPIRLAEDIEGIPLNNYTINIRKSYYKTDPIKVIVIYFVAVGDIYHTYRLINARAVNEFTY